MGGWGGAGRGGVGWGGVVDTSHTALPAKNHFHLRKPHCPRSNFQPEKKQLKQVDDTVQLWVGVSIISAPVDQVVHFLSRTSA